MTIAACAAQTRAEQETEGSAKWKISLNCTLSSILRNSACPARDCQPMRFWIDFPRVGPFRPGVLFGSGDVGRGRRSSRPFIVTEQHADPVELVFQVFLRLDREQRARLERDLY